MTNNKTDYTELKKEIANSKVRKFRSKEFTDHELLFINAILDSGNYKISETLEIVTNDQFILYQGITELSEVAYQYYKDQKDGAVADMGSFSLELVYELEQFVDWHKWGRELQKNLNLFGAVEV
ncbi:hypothetical protein [Salinicoccus carnicancri]|uniref:hypothetical protein n=1 Tax=Salinicoccus carnicancri TaxID=558170 RepID=UPI000381E015|nr:hypothetical protein [Salinicoccus carnicancri]